MAPIRLRPSCFLYLAMRLSIRRVGCHAGNVGRTGSGCCYLSGVVAFVAGCRPLFQWVAPRPSLMPGAAAQAAHRRLLGVVAAGEASHREPTHAVAAHGCRLTWADGFLISRRDKNGQRTKAWVSILATARASATRQQARMTNPNRCDLGNIRP